MNIEGNTYKLFYVNYDFNMSSFIAIFQLSGGNAPINMTHSVVLTGEEARLFYADWTTDRQVYELLCDELGVDYSNIPNDIDVEVV